MSEANIQASTAPRADSLRAGARKRPLAPGRLAIRRLTVGSCAAVVVFYLGLRGAGYDAIIRQEVGIAIWCLVAFGLIVGFLPRAQVTPLALVPVVALTALALLTLLSLAWTGSSERTYAEFARVLIYLGTLLLAVLALNRHTWRAAAVGITVGAVGITGLAVASRLAPGTFPDYDIALAFDTDRLSFPLDYWNAIAAWGAMTAAMALGWSSNLRIRWARALSLAAVPLAVTAVYLSYSRAGAIGIALGVVAVVALSRNRWTAVAHIVAAGAASAVVIAVIRGEPAIADATGTAGAGPVGLVLLLAMGGCAAAALATASLKLDRVRLPPRSALVAVPVGLVAAVLGGLVIASGPISDAWDEFKNQQTVVVGDDPASRLTTAAGTRSDVWDSAIDAFQEKPILGIGPGTFEYWWSENGEGQFLRDAHSLYAEELAELGLLGFICLLGLFGVGVALGVRTRFAMRRSTDVAATTALVAGVIVYLLHAGVDWMWEETAVTVIAVGSLGALLAASSERVGRGHGPSAAMRTILVVTAIAAVASQIPVLVSTARVRESVAALADRSVGEARTLADEAVDAEPWAATPYATRAAVEMRDGDYDAARADIQEAIDREPDNWRHRLALGQIDLADHRRDDAEAAFKDVLRLGPASLLPYRDASSLARYPAIRVATRDGCLAYQFGACFAAARPEAPRCLSPNGAMAAILDVRGVEPLRLQVVKVPVLNADPVYYAAGLVDGALTTWALDADAYRTGLGNVVPLNEAAKEATALGPPVDPALFGLSASDKGARAAASCLEG